MDRSLAGALGFTVEKLSDGGGYALRAERVMDWRTWATEEEAWSHANADILVLLNWIKRHTKEWHFDGHRGESPTSPDEWKGTARSPRGLEYAGEGRTFVAMVENLAENIAKLRPSGTAV